MSGHGTASVQLQAQQTITWSHNSLFHKVALLNKEKVVIRTARLNNPYLCNTVTWVINYQQPWTVWTGLLQTTRALKVRQRKFHVIDGEAAVWSSLGRAVGLCSPASAKQKRAQTRLIESGHLSEQHLTKLAEYNVKNSCRPLHLERHCIIIYLMASLYCSNTLPTDDFTPAQHLTEWCHFRWCNLLILQKYQLFIFSPT